MSVLDHAVVSQRYFFPRRAPLADPVWVDTPGGRLACWRSAPPSDRPVLVHFHGNGEIVHDWQGVFGPLCEQLGWDVFLAEYRGYGASEGTPALDGMLDDVACIARAVGVPASQTVVFGRSVGSLYALEWLARYPQTRGGVIESGIHDVLQRLLLRMHPHELGCDLDEMIDAVTARFDHSAKLAGYAGPTLFLHAQGDDLVTPDHARDNAAAAQDPRLVILPRGDHNSILAANPQAYVQELAGFLRRVGPATS